MASISFVLMPDGLTEEQSRMMRAVLARDCDTVLKYLEAGGDPNLMVWAVYGPASLLHCAIQYGNDCGPNPVAQLLVEWGADLKSKDGQGYPVDYFIQHSGIASHYLPLLKLKQVPWAERSR